MIIILGEHIEKSSPSQLSVVLKPSSCAFR